MNKLAFGYLVSAVVFCMFFGALGYIGFAASTGASGGWTVGEWLWRPIRFGSIWWLISGIIAGVGVRYLMTHR